MAQLPEGMQIWTRAFFGFSPEEDGYVGWTEEPARDRYLERLNDCDLLIIYGASSKETKKTLRSYVLGFVQIDATAIRDYEKASHVGMVRKRDAGWADKWSYAIPVRRAWRAEDKLMISRVAFNSYRPEAGQALAVHGTNLDPDEIAIASKIKVREVNVFGEPPISTDDISARPLAEVFRPSIAFSGGTGERTSSYEDGDTYLYLALYGGDHHAFLGREKTFGDKSVAMKIGVTNSLERRCHELNAGIPPAATGKWYVGLKSQPFKSKKAAEEVETIFKHRSGEKLESLGGEFFWGRLEDAERLFSSLPGVSRF